MNTLNATGAFLCALAILPSCSPLTPDEAMAKFEELSPIEGAEFLVDNREDTPFLDTLYADYVMPVVLEMDYYTIKNVLRIVGDSLAGESFADDFLQIRYDYLEAIHDEVLEAAEIQKQTFVDCILQCMQVGLDSMLNDDIDQVIDDYAGGILNWRKLKFFAGAGVDDFKKHWGEHIDGHRYTAYLADFVDSYLAQLASCRNEYYHDIITREDFYYIKTPFCHWWFSRQVDVEDFLSRNDIEKIYMRFAPGGESIRRVEEFTKSEKSGMLTDAVKDVVAPAVLTAMTCGAYAWVVGAYEVGTLTYDISEAMNEIQSPEDELKCVCMEDAGTQISESYLKKYVDLVNENIDVNARRLYEQIAMNL